MRPFARLAVLLLAVATFDAHARRVIVFVWDGMRPDVGEALTGRDGNGLSVKPVAIATDKATGPTLQRADGSPMSGSSYGFVLKTKQLDDNSKTYAYFDQAKAERSP